MTTVVDHINNKRTDNNFYGSNNRKISNSSNNIRIWFNNDINITIIMIFDQLKHVFIYLFIWIVIFFCLNQFC